MCNNFIIQKAGANNLLLLFHRHSSHSNLLVVNYAVMTQFELSNRFSYREEHSILGKLV